MYYLTAKSIWRRAEFGTETIMIVRGIIHIRLDYELLPAGETTITMTKIVNIFNIRFPPLYSMIFIGTGFY